MVRILLLSDTHGHIDDRILQYAETVDEVWHAGDIGTPEVLLALEKVKPLRAVYGNIDGHELRRMAPGNQFFEIEGLRVWITHIGGYPGRYSKGIPEKLTQWRPGLFICGHSHILKVMPDKKRQLLHMNPGAAGHHGFHKVRTMLRFQIRQGKVEKLEAIELGLRGRGVPLDEPKI
jgi:putative phosphoesterase